MMIMMMMMMMMMMHRMSSLRLRAKPRNLPYIYIYIYIYHILVYIYTLICIFMYVFRCECSICIYIYTQGNLCMYGISWGQSWNMNGMIPSALHHEQPPETMVHARDEITYLGAQNRTVFYFEGLARGSLIHNAATDTSTVHLLSMVVSYCALFQWFFLDQASRIQEMHWCYPLVSAYIPFFM